MKVFVSWSGERSQVVAKAIRDWLPLVLHYAEPWVSEADIDAGERWAQSVAGELDTSNFGIVCVTSENLNSPWVLFEAGALTKSLESGRVIPLLLDLDFTEISGPLAQFQAKKLNRAGVQEVILSIQSSSELRIPEERARQLFEALWPELEKQIAQVPGLKKSDRQVRPQQEVLEELVASVRSVDARVRDYEEILSLPPRVSREGKSSRHPFARLETLYSALDGPDDPLAVLVFAGVFRDEVPWIYDLALEAYRELSRPHRGANRAAHDLLRRVEMTMMRTHFFEELGMDPRLVQAALSELRRILERPTIAEREIVSIQQKDTRTNHGG